MKLHVEIKGTKNIQAALARLGQRAPRAMGAALWKEGNNIMTAAKFITPVDTSTLKNSGIVNLPVITDTEVIVEMGFGGAAKDYAEIQHEEPSYQHTPPTQYKFLEKPLLAAQTGMRQRLFVELWDELERGA